MYVISDTYNKSFYYPAGKVPTPTDIINMIGVKKVQNATFTRLDQYYQGQQDIMMKPRVDATQPCNRVVENYCQVIVDFYNTYLLGKPVQYKSKNQALLDGIKFIMDYTDAHDVDVANNQYANIMGASAEQLYIDQRGFIRFANVDYRSTIFVYNKDIEQELNSVIRYYKYDPTEPEYTVELWTPSTVTVYKLDDGFAKLRVIEAQKSHPFNSVPFVEYINNDYRASSFASILTLQDALNTLSSLEIDDYEAFVDSFLGIYNAAGTNDDDIRNMKVNRVLLLDGESRAEWITKNSNPAQIESIKESIIAAIHKVTSLPDLSDQNFSSNASGVAIKYKMIGAENIAAKQERKFKRGLQKRLSIIVDYINLVNNTNYSYLDVEIVFNRNMIGADLEIAQMIQLINGSGIPVKNLASQFSFITEADLASLNDTDNNTN